MGRITRIFGSRTLLYGIGVAVVALITLFIAMNVLKSSNETVNAATPPTTASAPKSVDNKAADKQTNKAAKDKTAKEKAAKDKAAKEKAAKDKAAKEKAAKDKVAKDKAARDQVAAAQAASQQATTTEATTPGTTSQAATTPGTTSQAATTPGTTSQAATTAAPAVPSGSDIYLTVPAMGISNSYVANTSDPSALENGAIHLPQTGFPWQAGSNTYIAGHVLGYAGTGSYLQFANLPNMVAGDMIYLSDSNGTTYTYRVFKTFIVTPYDTYVTAPIPGQTVVTLQTCVNPPAYDQRYLVQGELVSTS